MQLNRILHIFLSFMFAYSSIENPDVTSIVQCDTTKGPLTIEVYREWAPRGADRFVELVKEGFFTDIALFRCVDNFLTQFGITENPKHKHWYRKQLQDDPMLHIPVKKNYLSFAGGGPNTRDTQLFIAFDDLDFLGKEPWETPFGKVVQGQSTLDNFYRGNGDIPPFGKGPDQQKIHNQGNAYVRKEYPKTDFINSCQLIESADFVKLSHEDESEEEDEEESLEAHDDEKDPDGRTMLHSAAAEGNLNKIEEVLHKLDHHTDIIHIRDENGWQAIHEASRGGYLEIVRLLVAHGADIGAQTEEGDTPLDVAKAFEQDDLVAYLEEIGAPEGEHHEPN